MSADPIKVWMVDLPPLLADMAIAVFGEQEGFELIVSEDAEAPQGTEALLTVRSPASVEHLLWTSPQLHAFVIGPDARTVRIRMSPVREDVGELSFGELCAVIETSIQGARRLRHGPARLHRPKRPPDRPTSN